MIPKSMKMVTIPIHISAVLYSLIALGSLAILFIPMPGEDDIDLFVLRITWGIMCIVSVALVIFLEIVVMALKKGHFWAWIAGICIAGLYIPSGFMILGIIMLIGLLREEITEFCKKKNKNVYI